MLILFPTCFSGSDDDDHDHRLKKLDPFIDEFVTREYTDYLAIKPKELLPKQVDCIRRLLFKNEQLID